MNKDQMLCLLLLVVVWSIVSLSYVSHIKATVVFDDGRYQHVGMMQVNDGDKITFVPLFQKIKG